MQKSVTAIYPGTFDPITLGHEDLVRRASCMFDRVIVAVAVGHHKKAMFDLGTRIAMVRETVGELPGVEVEQFEGLVVRCAQRHRAKVMLRGLRSGTDFDYENQLAGMNRVLAPEIETVFLTPRDGLQHISSTLVREITKLGGEITTFVSPSVRDQLLQYVSSSS